MENFTGSKIVSTLPGVIILDKTGMVVKWLLI